MVLKAAEIKWDDDLQGMMYRLFRVAWDTDS